MPFIQYRQKSIAGNTLNDENYYMKNCERNKLFVNVIGQFLLTL